MTAITRTRRDIREAGDGCSWIIYGPAGAISWELLNVELHSRAYGLIWIHSPRPLFDFQTNGSVGCWLLEMPCFGDSSELGGKALGERWDAAGRDDDVIWAELESWYAYRLAARAVNS
jgi:hypothetical protein